MPAKASNKEHPIRIYRARDGDTELGAAFLQQGHLRSSVRRMSASCTVTFCLFSIDGTG